MARIKKKGTSGAATNYLTRSQAVRKLQIPLSDFRRLCIYKGIYPREPRSKKRASKSSTPSTTFYYAKDIHYLLHEPLLAKFRDQKALAKKISKALGRNEVSDAVRLERNLTPRLTLDHVIKERYPTFVDALRDLDDALSVLFLFAHLPATAEVPAKTIAKCRRLTTEFEHYLIRTSSLRKSFLSIKGIYYQATIEGQDILWLVPYKFVQRTEGMDVDFRIMATFVEFYACLLGFVNLRLFTGCGVVYPLVLDVESEEMGAGLGALRVEGIGERDDVDGETNTEGNERAQEEADRLLLLPQDEHDTDTQPAVPPTSATGDATEDTTLDHFTPLDPTADSLLQPSSSTSTTSTLFAPFTIFLSRETPRHPLEFLLKSFGCKRVGWDTSLGDPGSYCAEDDDRITHQVVDRPENLPLPSPPLTEDGEEEGVARKVNERVPGRIYVQPQWVWDCVNQGALERADLYAPGATLPPHLSPWGRKSREVYDPTEPLAEDEGMEGLEEGEADAVEGAVGGDESVNANGLELVEEGEEDGGMEIALAASDDDEALSSSDEQPTTTTQASSAAQTKAQAQAQEEQDDWAGFSGSDSDPDDTTRASRQAQAELEAEARGQPLPLPSSVSSKNTKLLAKQKAVSKAEREKREEIERRKMMMPRRKRKMFEKMVWSNARKEEEAERLRGKRRRVGVEGGSRVAG